MLGLFILTRPATIFRPRVFDGFAFGRASARRTGRSGAGRRKDPAGMDAKAARQPSKLSTPSRDAPRSSHRLHSRLRLPAAHVGRVHSKLNTIIIIGKKNLDRRADRRVTMRGAPPSDCLDSRASGGRNVRRFAELRRLRVDGRSEGFEFFGPFARAGPTIAIACTPKEGSKPAEISKVVALAKFIYHVNICLRDGGPATAPRPGVDPNVEMAAG